ncbi:Structural maintenance of chromosomes protein 5 [Trichinella pseudospiralis]|uniref:Structural maintenance of chromosomes protein 5 n=1 Tax=Trichinella pseudospiralis TaxID=6337 RepID=A0A0V1ISA1_TRIPS|nr:Structural maintenance of chromosomes protein 5 [Trichinella pseudospiralis]
MFLCEIENYYILDLLEVPYQRHGLLLIWYYYMECRYDTKYFYPGAICSIKLENFMIHDKFLMHPGPDLNMVFAPNGTGKSAILCAVCLVFGGTPKIIGRSARVEDYIKWNRNEARIHVEIASEVKKREKFSLIIRKQGKTQHYVDGVASTRKAVRIIAQKYQIQVNNICQFLAQDRVVEFSKQSPVDLLKNTIFTVGQCDLKEKYDTMHLFKQNIAEAKSAKKCHLEKQKELHARICSLEPSMRAYRYQQRKKEELRRLKTKLSYVHYEQARIQYCDVDKEYMELKQSLKQLRQQYSSVFMKLNALENNIHRLHNLFQKNVQTKGVLRSKIRRIRNSQLSGLDVKHKLRRAVYEWKKITEHINNFDKIKQSLCDSVEEHKKMVDTKEKQIPKLMDSRNEIQASIDNLKPILQNVETVVRACSSEFASAKRQTEIARDQLLLVKHIATERLNLLGKVRPTYREAYLWLCRNRSSLKGNFYLPFLTVNVASIDHGLFIENTMSFRDLTTFLFDLTSDLRIFIKYTIRADIKVSTGIAPAKYAGRIVQMDDSLRHCGFGGVVSDCIIAPQGVKNYMRILGNLDRILFGSTTVDNNLDRATMCVANHRLSRFITTHHNGFVFCSPYTGRVSTSCRSVRPCRIFALSVKVYHLKNVEENFQAKNNLCQEKRIAFSKAQAAAQIERDKMEKFVRAKNEVQSSLNEIANLRQRLQRLENNLQELIDDYPRKVIRVDVVRIEMISHFEILTKCWAALFEEFNTLITIWEETNERHHESVLTYEVYEKELKLTAKERELRRVLQEQVNMKEKEWKLKKVKALKTLANLMKALGKPLQTAIEIIQLPKEYSGLSDSVDELNANIKIIEEILKNADPSIEKDAAEYMRLSAENEKMNIEFASLDNKVKELNFAFQNSKLEFGNAMGNAIGEISKQFCRFMSQLDGSGEISLENCPTETSCDYGLNIKVKFSGNRSLRKLDHRRQSGGERCVSTMLYMLALQKSCKVPFRFLDEINQGVDEQNERLLMQLINSIVQELKSDTYCEKAVMVTIVNVGVGVMSEQREEEGAKQGCFFKVYSPCLQQSRKKPINSVLASKLACGPTKRSIEHETVQNVLTNDVKSKLAASDDDSTISTGSNVRDSPASSSRPARVDGDEVLKSLDPQRVKLTLQSLQKVSNPKIMENEETVEMAVKLLVKPARENRPPTFEEMENVFRIIDNNVNLKVADLKHFFERVVREKTLTQAEADEIVKRLLAKMALSKKKLLRLNDVREFLTSLMMTAKSC